MSSELTLDKLEALYTAATPGRWVMTTEEQAHNSVWMDEAKEKELQIADLNYIDAVRTATPALIAIAREAIRVHQYEDSPLPNAQLLYDDAMFELGEAIQAWEEL